MGSGLNRDEAALTAWEPLAMATRKPVRDPYKEWLDRVWDQMGKEAHAEMLKRGMSEDEFKAKMMRMGRKLDA